MTDSVPRFQVHLEPGGHELLVSAGDDVLSAALAAGIPLPHGCRAGRCASCKARLLSGEIAYPDGRLPPGIVAAEAARGEVLLCQARPRSDLQVQSRLSAGAAHAVTGVMIERTTLLPGGARRVTLRFVGSNPLRVRPGQFIDVETAAGERERVPVVAVGEGSVDVEGADLDGAALVRARGPFDVLR